MFAKPQAEHEWLSFLQGRWRHDVECSMGPDQPPTKTVAEVRSRSLGGMWHILEFSSSSPEGEPWTSIMTLGYDGAQKRYVGSFVGSMMSHQWVYTGQIDGTGKLILDAVGPRFDNTGMTNYQDIIERVSDDEWILSSRMQQDSGEWVDFMRAVHTRHA